MGQGKVWLLGAGPSDVGLLTVKGKQVLEQAEVVVYDSLVGQSILTLIPRTAELIFVGKRSGNHTVPQEEINEIMLEEAGKGKEVVRLKGGDPFLFGRGGEELELLSENGIPFEVIPGVSSPFAVPAYNGIPVTYREFCSSVHIVTGHRRQGASYDINFKALADTKGTLIFLMGLGSIHMICQGLMQAGMPEETPAGVLQQGTSANQKRVISTLNDLEEEVKKQGIEAPAIIIVGEVCTLAGKFAWYEKKPLFGKRIVVTRPKGLISRMAGKLRDYGAEVLEVSAIRTEPLALSKREEEKIRKLEQYQWIVFTSPTGVKVFFDLMKKKKIDIRTLCNSKIAVIGKGTMKEVEERGMFVSAVPEEIYDGSSLGKLLGELCQDGDKILVPRAKKGNHEIIEEIQKKKNTVIDDLAVYDTIYEKSPVIDLVKEVNEETIDYAVFTSASTVRGFADAAKGADMTKVTAACIGTQTAKAAQALGMKTYTARKAAMDDLAELLLELSGRSQERNE